jgi:N-acyl homoserine lactone hydrolase
VKYQRDAKMLKMLFRVIAPAVLAIFLVAVGFAAFEFTHLPYQTKPYTGSLITGNLSQEKAPQISGTLVSENPSISVRQIHSGDLNITLSNLINLNHPLSKGITDKVVTIPIFAYLVHHEKFGYFLIDTGCDPSYETSDIGPMKGLLPGLIMPKIKLLPGQSIDSQLGEIMHSLKGVFFTHLHFDHTSGVAALPENLLLIADRRERSFSFKWFLEPNHFRQNDTLYGMDFSSNEARDSSVGRVIDIFGDASLFAISTPGHSSGHVSYLVNAKGGPTLITGDAIVLNENMKIGVASGTSSQNQALDQQTFEKLLKFIHENPGLTIWPGHDFPE